MNQNDIDKLYNNRFFKRRIKKYHNKEIILAKVIHNVFSPDSVFDIGCALGSYLLKYKELGSKVSGCDKYFEYAKKYCDSEILPFLFSLDAEAKWDYSKYDKYHLVQCIEVAEHVKFQSSRQLVENICNMSLKYVLFTAAPPGQRGTGHINCQTKGFWINLFNDNNFIIDINKQEELMNAIKKSKNYLGIVRNIMVFKINC